jgi:hypothetical protein
MYTFRKAPNYSHLFLRHYKYIFIYLYIVLKPPYSSSFIIAHSTNDVIDMVNRKWNIKKVSV